MQDMYNDALVDTANFTAQLPFSITAFCLWAQRPQFQEGVPSSVREVVPPAELQEKLVAHRGPVRRVLYPLDVLIGTALSLSVGRGPGRRAAHSCPCQHLQCLG